MEINNFYNRYSVGNILTEDLKGFFDENEIELIPFGMEEIAKNNKCLKEFLSTPDSNFSHSAMLIKFAPDFILLKKTEPKQVYFIETKDSVTPLCYQSIIKEIEYRQGRKVPVSDIGIIAREAWNAYRNLFPNLIIVSASTYNKSLLKAQFVDNIICLRCFNGPRKQGYDCFQCPVSKGEFFSYDRNLHAEGSQTPHTNIDLASFMEFKDFFNELSISVNDENINKFKEKLKNVGVKYSRSLSEKQKEEITKSLIENGCEWLKK